MDLPSSVCSGMPLVVVAGLLRCRPTLGLGAGDGTLRGLPLISGGVKLLPCKTGLVMRGIDWAPAVIAACGNGSSLDPGGLEGIREGMQIRGLRCALVALETDDLADAEAGMGSPVEVVLSLRTR